MNTSDYDRRSRVIANALRLRRAVRPPMTTWTHAQLQQASARNRYSIAVALNQHCPEADSASMFRLPEWEAEP
jgi:hypothetical protein